MSFIKRHKILFILFAVSIFLMIKNSSIPYFFAPPAIISFIFDAPKSDFFSGMAQMIDIFTSAYVTSLVFYYMVDYLPAIKQEKKAKEIIAPKLVSLYLYISELLAMIKYAAEQEKLLQTGKPEDMDKLHFKNKVILCKQKSFKNEVENGTTPYSFDLLKDCDNFRTLILNICNEISGTPSFSYCDTQVIHIISEIQLSELLRILPKPNDFLLQIDFADVSYLGLGEGYQQLLSIYKELAVFVDTRHGYEMIDISKEEIQEWQEEQVESLKEHPEIAQILIANQRQNK